MNRRSFFEKVMLGSSMPLFAQCDTDEIALAECFQLSDSISKYPQLIINSDLHDAHWKGVGPESKQEFVSRRLFDIAESADYNFYSTGTTHMFTHRTKIGARFQNDFISSLETDGEDPLSVASEYIHEKGKKIFFSLRMNDTHDAINENILTDWKLENSDALVGTKGQNYTWGGDRWSAMDFEKEATRQYIFSIIQEVVQNYVVDGIELDFYRHPILFKNQLTGLSATEEQIDIITNLVGDIRKLCDQHDLQLAVRVPDSIPYNLVIGIDLETWISNALVDIVSLSGYSHFNKWCSLGYLKELGNVKLFACLSKSRLFNMDAKMILPEYYWKNEAFSALANNFDGIYLFNVVEKDHGLYSVFNKESLNESPDFNYQEVKGFSAGYWVKDGHKYFNY